MPPYYDQQNAEKHASESTPGNGQLVSYRQTQQQKFQESLAKITELKPIDSCHENKMELESGNTASNETAHNTATITFRGLSNQGATCYMNSLLQTLYMTPEFRQGLYEWHIKSADTPISNDRNSDEDTSRNIPYQLQILFAELQLSSKRCVDTKSLTDSFGWNSSDVFQQHDVQELCRVLFDALERSFHGTSKADFVNELYRGTLKDYVKCCACDYESSRLDHFLDLSLVIRPFGFDRAGVRLRKIQSLEEALELFLKPEVLELENQWNCERCQTKQDAIKGLKFSKLPYLLSLQLKRFDFDYTTMDRIKLHDRIVFPKYLNMNVYVGHDEDRSANGNCGSFVAKKGEMARKLSLERNELEKMQRRKLNRIHELPLPPAPQVDEEMNGHESIGKIEPGFAKEDDPGMQTWDPKFDVQTMFADGPCVYELYSVLVHSGSAMGGHYFAYIKSFENQKWYNFNDSHVSEISEEDIRAAFGGERATPGGSQYVYRTSYSTCAYMLMYRLVSADQNVESVSDDQIPEYLRRTIEKEEARLREEERLRIERLKQVALKIHTINVHGKRIERELLLYKNTTVGSALDCAVQAFAKEAFSGLTDINSPTQVRFRDYNSFNGTVSASYEYNESKTLYTLRFQDFHQLFLETKQEHEDWEPYDSGQVQSLVTRFQSESEINQDFLTASTPSYRWIQLDTKATVRTLYAKILQFYYQATKDTFPRKIRILRKSHAAYACRSIEIVNKEDDDKSLERRLSEFHISDGVEFVFEVCDDLSSPSDAFKKYDEEANMIAINVRYENEVISKIWTIHMDRRSSYAMLKDEISVHIGLAADQFALFRAANNATTEIKIADVSLQVLCIGNNCTLYVSEGQPLHRGEYRCRLIRYYPEERAFYSKLCNPNQVMDLTDEDLHFTDTQERVLRFICTGKCLQPTGSIVVSDDIDVRDLRLQVFKTLHNKPSDQDNLTMHHIRLRDLQQGQFTRVLADGHKLSSLSQFPIYEGQRIVYEILSEAEEVSHHCCLFTVAVYDPSTRTFPTQKRKEFLYKAAHGNAVHTSEDTEELTQFLNETIGSFCDIPAEFLGFAQIASMTDPMTVLNASDLQFYSTDEMVSILGLLKTSEDLLVTDIRCHGKLLDTLEQERLEECVRNALKVGDQNAERLTSAVDTNTRYIAKQKPKEAALVIRSSKPSADDRK